MQNINPHAKTQPAFVTTWTEVATGADDIEVTCTRAGEEGKQHFITFLSVSTDANTRNQGRGVRATLKSAGITVLEMWPRAQLQVTSFLGISADGVLPLSYPAHLEPQIDSDSGPWFMEFEAPLQIGLGEAATFESAMDGETDSVSFAMGGFTSDVRIL